MPESTLQRPDDRRLQEDPSRLLSRFSFCFSILLFGALASRLAVPGRRKHSARRLAAALALVLLLPLVLEFARLVVESYPPSLRDLTFELSGTMAGFITGLLVPAIVRPLVGFLFLNLALVAAGLSPFHFRVWQHGMSFQWIPFYEFCVSRTPAALYEITQNLFSFALLGGMLQVSFIRWRRWQVVAYVMALAAAIEFAQTFLPVRSAGSTDILMAGLGAWTGALMCAAVESARGFENQGQA